MFPIGSLTIAHEQIRNSHCLHQNIDNVATGTNKPSRRLRAAMLCRWLADLTRAGRLFVRLVLQLGVGQ